MQHKSSGGRTKLRFSHIGLGSLLTLAMLASLILGSHTSRAGAAEPRVLAIAVSRLPDMDLPAAVSRPGWTDPMCGSCHKVSSLFSHPVNVVPTMATPSSLPLQNGKMTCMTCHADQAEQHMLARQGQTSMLRNGLTGTAFCRQCHDHNVPTRQAQHGSALGIAHLAWPGRKKPASDQMIDRLDAETHTCLSCHDGTTTRDIGLMSQDRSGLSDEHPIGVELASSVTPSSTLRTASEVDARVRLYDNQVGCGSCHSPFSHESKLLVMSNNKSSLCLSCHQ